MRVEEVGTGGAVVDGDAGSSGVSGRERTVASRELSLAGTELDAADLARDRLRQLGELEPPDPLPRREVLTRIPEDRQGRLLGGLVPGREHDVRLGDR